MCGAETGINPIERYYCEKGGGSGLTLPYNQLHLDIRGANEV